jgi:hypothetical protein
MFSASSKNRRSSQSDGSPAFPTGVVARPAMVPASPVRVLLLPVVLVLVLGLIIGTGG